MNKWEHFYTEAMSSDKKPKDENLKYLHGFIHGFDFPGPTDLRFSIEVDQTEYHALVLDWKLWEAFPDRRLKDALTGKDLTAVVDKLKTTDPEEALKFYNKYMA